MDIQFIQFNDALPVNSVEEVPDLLPRSLRITGVNLRNAIEVKINDSNSPSFVVASDTVIIAQVPTSQTDGVINAISVLSGDFTATIKSQIRFLFGNQSKGVTGIKALIQSYLKILLTAPGSNEFNKRSGGGALLGVGNSTGQGLTSSFAAAVTRTTTEMVTAQARQSGLPDDERLLDAVLLNLHFDPANTAVVARIEIISQAGTRAITNLEL